MSLAREGKRLNETLYSLQNKGDIFTKQMVVERKRIMDLEGAIAQADRQETAMQRRLQQNAVDVLNLHSFSSKKMTTADGWNPSLQGIVSQKKMVTILENRLNKLRTRLSQYDHENKQVKDQIDVFRRRRIESDRNRSTLEVKLEEIQGCIQDMLHGAAGTSDKQQMAIEAQQIIGSENEYETHHFEDSFKMLGTYVQSQLKEFEESVQQAAKEVMAQVENTENPRGDLSVTQEETIKTRLAELAHAIEVQRLAAQATQERIDRFNVDIGKLKQAAKHAAAAAGFSAADVAKLDDIEEIKSFYIRITDETFSLFTYNLEQIRETETILEQVEAIEAERAQYEQEMSMEDSARAEIVQKKKKAVEETREQLRGYGQSATEAQKTISMLGKKVQNLFYKIQCDQIGARDGKGKRTLKRADSQMLLASSANGVTESNILAYMELIEQRVVEIVSGYARKKRGPTQVVLSPTATSSVTRFKEFLQAPESHMDDNDTDTIEFDHRPMPLHLLRMKAAEKMNSLSMSPDRKLGTAEAFPETN